LRGANPDLGIPRRLAVVNVHIVDDDVGDVINDQTTETCYLHVGSSAIDGLETADEKLIPEIDYHIT